MTFRTRILAALLLAGAGCTAEPTDEEKPALDPAEQQMMLTGNFPIGHAPEDKPAAASEAKPTGPSLDLAALGLVPPKGGPDTYAAGRAIFTSTCAACHQQGGQGIPGAIPPLAGSDFATGDKLKVIGVLVNGLSGPVTVNGKPFNSMMPKQAQLSEVDVAAVLSFVRNNLTNHVGDAITPAEVKAVMGGGGTPNR